MADVDAAIGTIQLPYAGVNRLRIGGIDDHVIDDQIVDLPQPRQPLPCGAAIGRLIDPARRRTHIYVRRIRGIVGKAARVAALRTHGDPLDSSGLGLA